MKMRSVKYLVGEGFSNAWANRLMTLASVGVLVACMVVIGLAILISENVTMALGNLEKQNVIMVYMKDYNWALYVIMHLRIRNLQVKTNLHPNHQKAHHRINLL